VRRVADLGRKRLAYVILGGQQIVATIPPAMSSIGDQAKVVFDPRRTHVYVDDIRVTGAAAWPQADQQSRVVLRSSRIGFVLFSSIILVTTVVNYSIQDRMTSEIQSRAPAQARQ
jgi:hypothetical protein